mmetsp:Transcript_923/g.1884  ORF Transcript_923/g.1884 Transcript_923/m.1884 type:complete len:212 (+) Transcript_923:1342-1977(+)
MLPTCTGGLAAAMGVSGGDLHACAAGLVDGGGRVSARELDNRRGPVGGPGQRVVVQAPGGGASARGLHRQRHHGLAVGVHLAEQAGGVRADLHHVDAHKVVHGPAHEPKHRHEYIDGHHQQPHDHGNRATQHGDDFFCRLFRCLRAERSRDALLSARQLPPGRRLARLNESVGGIRLHHARRQILAGARVLVGGGERGLLALLLAHLQRMD